MGQVFISYSHHDTSYAHALAESLQGEGFEVWIDERMDYGSQWPLEIQKQLDSCSAFILIMSPRSYSSEWVQSELQRAKRKLKPIFPLLLEGDEPWLSVESTQYFDVRGGKFPDTKFYSALRRVVSSTEGQAASSPVDVKKTTRSPSPARTPKLRIEIVIAIIGAAATLLAAIIPMIWSSLSKNSMLLPTTQATSPTPASSSTNTSQPGATSTVSSATPLATKSSDSSDSADFIDSKDVPMRMVPAEEFLMGSASGDVDEVPVHTVYLDAYYIDKYEVTNVLYKACVNAGVCYPPHDLNYYGNSQYANHPVLYVDWDMARAYCEWRSAKLPSEAQWEKAARGTDARTYPWGEGIDCSRANYSGCSGNTSNVMTHQIGISPYGAYDMAGNAWEWVSDWYSDTYYQTSPTRNPPGPVSGILKVVRSGAWNVGPDVVRTSLRNAKPPSSFDNDIGFRCAMDATP
jgi:formylglycine-generating enzyme required for sulfatase activity